MQGFLRPDHATHLKEEPSPSSAPSHPMGSAVLPRVLQSPGKFLLLEEFQRAEMHPGLGAEPPGRTTKDSWAIVGLERDFKQLLCIMHWAHWIVLYRGSLWLHTRLTSTPSVQVLIIMARTALLSLLPCCTSWVWFLGSMTALYSQLPCEQTQSAAVAVTQQLEHAAHTAVTGTAAMCYPASGLGQLNICFPQGNNLCCISLREKKLVYFIFSHWAFTLH